MADVLRSDTANLHRAGAFALRALGVATIAGALAFGAAFAYVAGTVGIVVGLGVAALGGGVGALLMRGAARRSAAAEADERRRRELAILALAEEKNGVLRVTDLSRRFAISAEEAEAMLASMADGSRVTMEITSDGLVEYAFRELEASTGKRVRVDVEPRPAVELEPVEVARDSEDARRSRT